MIDYLTPTTTFEVLLQPNRQQAIHYSIGFLSAILNSTIIYFIFCKTPKYLSEYSYFLFHITLSDLLFNFFLTFLMTPMPIFPIWGAVIHGPIRLLDEKFESIFISFDIAMFLFIYCLYSINYASIYRYLWVAKPKWLIYLVNWKVQICIGIFSICIGFGVIWIHHLYLYDRQETNELVQRAFPQLSDTETQLKSYTVFIFKPNLPLELLVLIGVPFCTMFNLVLAQQIFTHLKSMRGSTMSEMTYLMNRRMTQALIVQTLSPLALFSVPLVVIFIAMLTNYSQVLTIELGTLIITMLALNSIANALSTLFFVKPYWRLLFGWTHRESNNRTRIQSTAF